jgi:hypothetical protein
MPPDVVGRFGALSLHNHWMLTAQVCLACDQCVPPPKRDEELCIEVRQSAAGDGAAIAELANVLQAEQVLDRTGRCGPNRIPGWWPGQYRAEPYDVWGA